MDVVETRSEYGAAPVCDCANGVGKFDSRQRMVVELRMAGTCL